jgi:hypothetical protein
MLGIVTSGRVPTLEEAKAQFLASWQKCCANSAVEAGAFLVRQRTRIGP